MDVADKKTTHITGSLRVHDLDECRNTQTGPVFIVASGASAKDFPLHKYAGVPMITMNGAISKFTGTGIKPYFYVCTDQGFSEQQPELFTEAMRISERVALWEKHIWHTSLKPSGQAVFAEPGTQAFVERFFQGRQGPCQGPQARQWPQQNPRFQQESKTWFF